MLNIPALTYGADRTGLICGFVFAPAQAGRALDSEQALAWLDHPERRPQDEFAWLHMDLGSGATEKWIREHLDVPDAFFDALEDGARSTRIEYADGYLVAVINDVLFDFAFGASHIATLWLCVGPRFVLSARRKPLRSIDRLRGSVRRGDAFGSPVEILVHLLHDQVEVLVQIVRDATGRVDQIEDTLLADHLEPKRVNLGAVRRVLVRLQRLLAPEPAALFRLLSSPPPWIEAPQVQNLREASEEFSVALSDMSALVERIKLLQEEIAAQVNQQNNRSLFLLTVFTVIALPINIIAGLFGMNVGGVPFNQDERGFWAIVGLVLAFTVPALWVVLRRRRD